ncbi:MAG TPA: ABC transporter ATP-binding protein [Planctomycetota bacterium]|nr:ABC transporter ATP-binding protein [Planctomycetota bacterium]
MSSAATGVPGGGAGAGEVILEGKDLEKTYEMGDRGLKVLRGVSIDVRKGEILAIQGPSGAGKSTLLHLLGLLDEPDQGRVLYRGEDVLARRPRERARYRNQKIGFVFQFYHLFPDLDALENVCLPKMVELSWRRYGAEKAAIEERAKKLLGLVGLAERMTHLPSELSGGERQRVAIARALMNEPEIVLCDEPTGNLDQKRAGEILEVIWRLNKETGQTFVIVTHDRAVAERAHRAVHVIDGVIAEPGTEARPRGFADVRFKLRGDPAALRRALHPALAGVLCAIIPFFELLWLYGTLYKFQQATRRGRAPLGAVILTPMVVVGNIFAFFVHAPSLAAARRLLTANGAEPITNPWPPSILWGLGLNLRMIAAIALIATGWAAGWPHTLWAGGSILFGVATAWIQSLHNAFYDRMTREDA